MSNNPKARTPVSWNPTVDSWDVQDDRELTPTRIFTLRERRCRAPNGIEGDFVYLDSKDWVNVVAMTRDERVVLIEQYRHGIGDVTLEIPGGMVEPNEDVEEACRRELREETGFTSGQFRLLGAVSPNPAIQNNRCYTGLLTDVVPGEPNLDPYEDIAVRLAPLGEVPGLIRDGVIHHALVVAAFFHFEMAQRADAAQTGR